MPRRRIRNNRFKSSYEIIRLKGNNTYKRAVTFTRKRPLASFFVALGLLLLAIILNSVFTPKPSETSTITPPREVSVYRVGSAPIATFTAKVDKKGVIQIVAQTPGIVSNINVFEGQQVYRGNVLIALANNYQGGNALSVQREIAADQYKNIKQTYDTQKELIAKQRELADTNKDNADEMREIADASINDTQSLIDLNTSIVSTLQDTLSTLEANNTDGANDQLILSTRMQISQFQAAVNQLNAGQRQARFAADSDNPPTKLANIAHDIAIKQLDLQQKGLDLSKEVSRLGLILAQISEATMFPAAPFDGVVEKVHVVIGQSVAPGTPLVTLASNSEQATAVVQIPYDTAMKVSKIEESTLYIRGLKFKLTPEYISNEATSGSLNSVTYTLPHEAYERVSDGEYIKVDIPIGYPDTIGSIPYLPIDVISQTQSGTYVYVVQNNSVFSRKIILGDLVGGNVAVQSGLSSKDLVILDRNVIEGEKVTVK